MSGRTATALSMMLAALLLVSACASQPDLRYRDSAETAPLRIPAGLDTPNYNRSMEIPLVQRIATPGDDDIGIERPPEFDTGLRVRDATRLINEGGN